MRFYHRTTEKAMKNILKIGFRDATRQYMTLNKHTGVWISNVPWEIDGEAECLLGIDLSIDIIKEYEWIEEEKPYREFLVPAKLLNHGKLFIIEETGIRRKRKGEKRRFWTRKISHRVLNDCWK